MPPRASGVSGNFPKVFSQFSPVRFERGCARAIAPWLDTRVFLPHRGNIREAPLSFFFFFFLFLTPVYIFHSAFLPERYPRSFLVPSSSFSRLVLSRLPLLFFHPGSSSFFFLSWFFCTVPRHQSFVGALAGTTSRFEISTARWKSERERERERGGRFPPRFRSRSNPTFPFSRRRRVFLEGLCTPPLRHYHVNRSLPLSGERERGYRSLGGMYTRGHATRSQQPTHPQGLLSAVTIYFLR